MKNKIGYVLGVGLGGLCLGGNPASAVSFASVDAPTAMAAVVLNVTDLARSIAFYRLVGLKEGDNRAGEDPRVQFNMSPLEGRFLGGLSLHQAKEHSSPVNSGFGFDHIILVVDDVKALCDRLAAAQEPCSAAPTFSKANNALIGTAKDPDGYRLELIQPVR